MKTLKEQNIFSVNFFVLKSRPLSNGNLPIYVSIYYKSEQVQFSSKESTPPKNWDYNAGYAIGSNQEGNSLNTKLLSIKQDLDNIYAKLKELKIPITAKRVKDLFHNSNRDIISTNKETGFVNYFQKHLEDIKRLIDVEYTIGTYKKYCTTLNHLKEFIQITHRDDDIPFPLLSPSFFRELQNYIQIDKKCSHNTTIRYMKNVKKVSTMAFDDGLLEKNPFRGIKFRFEEEDTTYLDEYELKLLEDTEFCNDTLSNVRDIFIFCCYTGLAYIDVAEFKESEIIEHDDTLFINKRRRKTNQMSTIPLFKPALNIIEKYQDHPLTKKNNAVIPVLSNQKMNQYLKQIAEMCKIRKRLTTHVARHTFATTVTLANGISKDVVAKMLGHSSTRMTDRYARVTNDLVLKSTKGLADLLNKK